MLIPLEYALYGISRGLVRLEHVVYFYLKLIFMTDFGFPLGVDLGSIICLLLLQGDSPL